MMEFAREVKGQFRWDKKFKIQMWKWAIRPDRDIRKQAHKAKLFSDKKGQIGLDTHYFTVVNYCPGRYRIFDTVDPAGRDISPEWIENKALVAEGFSFEYSDTLEGEAKKCEYEDCVYTCVSKWMSPGKIKQQNVPKCLKGITL
eukprot:TRINITY_DN18899_c0_g1_i1.p1 TRINITY_DN18899_c0_g1~~TRINITY_DN18899_c0_g1_i1.p1  ORF type:complete len:144 (+),score=36.52 TRINITY_DN18899_c0_g1_i1:253-684(+)